MLFNSPVFIYLFLPLVVFIGNVLKARFEDKSYFIVFLSLSSFFFYGYTESKWIIVIAFSILFNYYVAGLLISSSNFRYRKATMILGVAVNLALLGYFKYTDFFLANINHTFGTSLPILGIVLPIGISFYTFQQIAFLVDAYHAKVTHLTFKRYVFFVTFFPQLIAGPIVHHAEILPQLAKRYHVDLTSDIALGLFIFLVGLAKKTLLADSFAGAATPIFDIADSGGNVSALDAWGGALAYTLQIYFDFSGYSDMAIGIARMFGLRLPINFNSPYKSVGIVEFWRRWHITLSRFLRDYLYIPLGGNRRGAPRRYLNLLITMVLGGIWHGAGWGFVIWGLLHGVFLTVEHGISKFFLYRVPHLAKPAARLLGWALTFIVIVLAWVPFRATTLDGALVIWHAMAGLAVGVSIEELKTEHLGWIATGLVIVLGLPNSQQIIERLFGYKIGTSSSATPDMATGTIGQPAKLRKLTSPTRARRALQVSLAACLGFSAAAGIALNNQITEFIYFQF